MTRILIVEDNADNRDILTRRLVRRGFEVLIAEDGEQAVALAQKELPDLILMDMNLPIRDGWSAARALRGMDATRTLPIIALTAHALAGDREKALAAGCDDYDTKPFEMPRLFAKIDALLSRRSAAVAAPVPPPAAAPLPAAAPPPPRAEVEAQRAHELRTPLGQIIGYSDLLLSEAAERGHEALTADLRKIRAAATRLQTLLNDLLATRGGSAPGVFPDSSPPVAGGEESDNADAPAGEAGTAAGLTDGAAGTLLVVDDNAANRDLLARRLTRQGYAVTMAEDGQRALDVLAAQPFDLVLLDVLMPGLDGYEVLARIKADERLRHVPVIMISALDDMESVVRCIELGAEDYLPKPFNPVLLRARVRASLEKKRLRDWETRLHKETERLLDRNRNIAVHLQEALTPPLPACVPGLDIRDFYQSALAESSVGGDFHDVFPLPDGRIALIIGDLSGKGLAAASQIAIVRHMLRYALYRQQGRALAATLTDLNDVLTGNRLLTGFATLFAGLFDPATNRLIYAACGHDPALLRRAASGQIEQLSTNGPVLGALLGAVYAEASIALAPGDALVLYTDGLSEAGRVRHDFLGVEGLARLLEAAGHAAGPSGDAAQLRDLLLDGVRAHARNRFHDDVCLLVARVTGDKEEAGPAALAFPV